MIIWRLVAGTVAARSFDDRCESKLGSSAGNRVLASAIMVGPLRSDSIMRLSPGTCDVECRCSEAAAGSSNAAGMCHCAKAWSTSLHQKSITAFPPASRPLQRRGLPEASELAKCVLGYEVFEVY
jgi:hypothetical protein